MKNKNAYITLADSEEHLRCAYALALSLNRVKSIYPLYIMIPRNSVNYENFPQVENTKIVEIPLLMFNGIDATGDFNTTVNKFFCLQYEEFDKVIFFDADVFVQSNIDYLFEEKFPIVLTENNEIRGEMFGLKTDIELLSLIINLVIRYNFSTDEQVLTHLFNKHFFKLAIPFSFSAEVKMTLYPKFSYSCANSCCSSFWVKSDLFTQIIIFIPKC